jgi:PKD repeat protein
LRIFKSKRMSIPKVAVLATGLAAAVMVATINPMPAQATPRASSCAGCHNPATPNVSTAKPSTATPAPGASYTVAITLVDAGNGGATGYGIVPVAPAVEKTFGGGSSSLFAYTATMIAPTAAGTYSYTVWTNQGPTDGTAQVGSVVYSITVAAAPVAVTTTTALGVTPASPVVAPGAPTLTATVTGAGAAGTVQFLNGTTVLGTSTVAAGRATLALTGVAAGTYSYTANFIPTSAAAFTPSTSSAVAYVVTVPVPVVVTTTTALTMAPTAATAVAPAAKTLTAAVSGAGAAGTVQFFNGTASLGSSPVAAGSATLALSNIAVGSYSYHAVFTPTNAALFTSSTSANLAFSVTAAPPVQVTTTTALTMAPTAATAVAPAAKTLTAAVTGANAAGTVQFFNGTASLGSSPVAAGSATLALSNIAVGSYSYHAVFTPTNAALFTSSTSGNLAFSVTAAPPVQVTTTTALGVTPASPVVAPGAPTLTATVTGAGAAGTVQFLNGTTVLGTSTVAAGRATLALTGVAAGSYSYTAKFIPTDAAAFTASTSSAVAYVVTAAPPVVIAPVANFTAAVSGLAVAMTDTSTNAPTSWSWNLGNGTTSTVRNPSVTYAAAGIYTVVLTATNSAGSSTATKTVTVSDSTPLPSAAFIRYLSTDEGRVGDKVTITGTGFGTPGVVKFGSATAKVVSWSATKIVVIVPAINSVTTNNSTPVWYRHDQEVRVTVTPAGAAASNGVEFEVKSSRYSHDD